MKRIAIVIAALASCLVMSAQDLKMKSRLELKGGKADVVGYAELQSDGGYVVETESGDIFYYSASEIKKITPLEADGAERVKTKKTHADRSKTKGYMGIIEAGVGLSNSYGYTLSRDDNNIAGYDADEYYGAGGSVSIINGYRFSPHFYMGLGAGWEVDLDNVISFPIYLHMRTEFTKKKVSPYIALSGGYVLPYLYSGGYFLEGALGLRAHCKRHGSMWYGLTASYLVDLPIPGEYYGDYMEAIAIKFKIAYSF